MPFRELTVDIGRSDPAPHEDLLASLGALSVTLEDAADDPVLEPRPGEMPLWPTVRVRALYDADADLDGIVAAYVAAFPGAPVPASAFVADRAWEREWLKDFHPMRFGRRLWVCPDGQPAGDLDAVRIELDPGLAFGTGTHPTTALCLEWLDGASLEGRRVVDYGCGSGILAIAALKLGAASVHAVDLDPQAILATRENAERNGVADRLTVTIDPGLVPAGAEALVANILAGPLVELAPAFAAGIRAGGDLALSGVLAGQVEAVTAAYRPWFDIPHTATREEWGIIIGRRRAD
ncbi:MAG: 50S ribosomal protein L11 methyltransferase [Steroidobacteraceae bacterium]